MKQAKQVFRNLLKLEVVVKGPDYIYTRKYPLRGYILGVLTHTTAWDQHWGGDETLKLVLVYVVWLLLS